MRTVDSEVDFAAAIAPQGEGRPISDRLQVQRVPARIEVQCGSNWGSGMRLLDLVRRQKVAVEVDGDVLVVTMPGTTFSISYEKSDENRLVASSFNARKPSKRNSNGHLSEVPQPRVASRERESKGAWLDLRRVSPQKTSARTRQFLVRRRRRFLRSLPLSGRVRLNIRRRRRCPGPSFRFRCVVAAAARE